MSTLPAASIGDDAALLPVAAEAREHLDLEREAGEPLAEGVEVLLREHGRRHEHGDLLAVHHGLERGAQGDLGLAVADVAADQAVHRARVLHVALDVVNGAELVGRLDVRERRLELRLPWRVGREGVALGDLARGVELQQLLRHLLDGAAHSRFRARPLLRAEASERRPVLARSDVAADAVGLVRRHEEAVGVRVLQLQVLALFAADTLAREPGEPRDAVLDVYDEVARHEVGEERFASGALPGWSATLLAEAEHLGVGEERQAGAFFADGPAVRERAVHQRERAAAELRLCHRVGYAGEDIVLFEQLDQALGLRRHDDDLLAAA